MCGWPRRLPCRECRLSRRPICAPMSAARAAARRMVLLPGRGPRLDHDRRPPDTRRTVLPRQAGHHGRRRRRPLHRGAERQDCGGLPVACPARAEDRPSRPGSMLTHRWRAYTRHAGRLLEIPVRHEPWPLQAATVTLINESLTAAAGLPAPAGAALAHYPAGVAGSRSARRGRPKAE